MNTTENHTIFNRNVHNIFVVNRVIFTRVHVILHTFLQLVNWPSRRSPTVRSLTLSPSRKCLGRRKRRVVALDFSRANECPTTSPPYTGTQREKITTITGGFPERALCETSPVAISAIRGGVLVFSTGEILGTTWRYHLRRTDRRATGRLMISRCMANAANCRSHRNWDRRDAAARHCSPRRRVRVTTSRRRNCLEDLGQNDRVF